MPQTRKQKTKRAPRNGTTHTTQTVRAAHRPRTTRRARTAKPAQSTTTGAMPAPAMPAHTTPPHASPAPIEQGVLSQPVPAIQQTPQQLELRQSLLGRLRNVGVGKEKDYLLENTAMLIGSGMDIVTALEAIKDQTRSAHMRTLIDQLRHDMQAGMPMWRALERTHLYAAHFISLLKIGDRSGRFEENLHVVVQQMQKDRTFKSKLYSALMYPVFILSVTILVGTGIAWFVLPRLTDVFSSLDVELPFMTRVLIGFGNFMDAYGTVAVPLFLIGLITAVYFVFFYHKTKHWGQSLLLHIPGVRKLVQELELGRMGYLLGNLLDAGMPLIDSLRSLTDATNVYVYRRLYAFMTMLIEAGCTFRESFTKCADSDHLIPASVQHMITASEQSGQLPNVFIRIGKTYEAKTDETTKNLMVMLEPILLVAVWIGVVIVALAVIMPIYSMISGLEN